MHARFGLMEISKQQGVDLMKRWKQDETTVGLHFAARGGTAGSTMLAKIAEVSSRIVFKNDSGSFHFTLYKARFADGPVRAFPTPREKAVVEIHGLHIWLESGHWLFISEANGLAPDWLVTDHVKGRLKGSGGQFDAQHDADAALKRTAASSPSGLSRKGDRVGQGGHGGPLELVMTNYLQGDGTPENPGRGGGGCCGRAAGDGVQRPTGVKP